MNLVHICKYCMALQVGKQIRIDIYEVRYMNIKARHLKVTIHDNDFTTSLEMISELLYETFQIEGRYPTEKDFPVLKECIKHLWFGELMASILMRWGKHATIDINCFEPHLEFVDYFDIPDWDNAESVYIPMFDGAKVLMR